MKFEIVSRYDSSDIVLTKRYKRATVCEVKMKLLDNYYRIYYLLEFDNKERKWVDENDII